MKRYTVSLLLLGAILGPSPMLHACSIPVFRYALGRWRPSPYEVVVFRRGELSTAAHTTASRLEEASGAANLRLFDVDLDKSSEPRWQKLWQTLAPKATLPWIAVCYPEAEEKAAAFWSGPLNDANVEALPYSPIRKRVAAALGKGESAVFLLLASGDAAKDDAAAKLIESTAARLMKTTELAMPTLDGPQLLYDLPLRVSFPLLRLSRGDRDEQFFVTSLLQSSEELVKAEGPILFPIFGRGRLLCALHGDDLCAEQIEKVVHFLCGACSCQVKELNPGVDLLMTAHWEQLLGEPIASDEPAVQPNRPGLTLPRISVPATEVSRLSPPAEWQPPSARRRFLWIAVVCAGVLMLATGYWWLRSRRSGASSPLFPQ